MQIEAAEAARPSSESFGFLFQSQVFLRSLFSSKVERVLERSRQEAPKTAHEEAAFGFDLLNVLIELVAEAQKNGKNLESYLHTTLFTQLEAALSEHIKLPFHTTYSEIDLDRFVTENRVFVFHPGYRKIDLLEYADNAIATEQDTEKNRRYGREKDQLENLYSVLAKELESSGKKLEEGESSPWQETQARYTLSARVLHDLGLQPNENVFVARKHGLSMPRNTEVYAEGLSYLNLYQLVFLPSQGRMILAMDHLYEELTNEQHAQAMRWLRDEKPGRIPPEATLETALMAELSTLNTESSLALPLHIFSEMLAHISPNKELQAAVFQEKTFQKQNEVKTQFGNVRSVATYLYKILVTELLVCQEHPAAVSGLKRRLNVALEMGLHPLFSGKVLQEQASLDAYKKTYLAQWIDEMASDSTKVKLVRPEILSQLLQQREAGVVTSHDVQQRNLAITDLSKSYGSILQGVLSKAQCASGSFGGLSDVMKLDSILGSVSGSPMLNFSQLSGIIGEQRAKEWKIGSCINPSCKFKGQQQFVGECSICLSCELEMSGFGAPERPERSLSESVKGIFDGPVERMPLHLQARRVIHESDVMAFLWSGQDLSAPLR